MDGNPENEPLFIMRENVGDYLSARLLHAIQHKHFAITANEKSELVFTGQFYTPDLVVCDDKKTKYSETPYAEYVESRKRENKKTSFQECLATIEEEDEVDSDNEYDDDNDREGDFTKTRKRENSEVNEKTGKRENEKTCARAHEQN